MLGEPHSIHHEFPQHRERIDALAKEHPEFRENPIADRDMETMKVERMHLKDEIYRRLNGG